MLCMPLNKNSYIYNSQFILISQLKSVSKLSRKSHSLLFHKLLLWMKFDWENCLTKGLFLLVDILHVDGEGVGRSNGGCGRLAPDGVQTPMPVRREADPCEEVLHANHHFLRYG